MISTDLWWKELNFSLPHDKLKNFIENLWFEVFTMSKIPDESSNDVDVLKLNNGIESQMILLPNMLGVFKA